MSDTFNSCPHCGAQTTGKPVNHFPWCHLRPAQKTVASYDEINHLVDGVELTSFQRYELGHLLRLIGVFALERDIDEKRAAAMWSQVHVQFNEWMNVMRHPTDEPDRLSVREVHVRD